MRRYETYPRPTRILTTADFFSAWKDCRDSKGKGGAPGVDKVYPQKFRENLETNIKRIREQILKLEYKFNALRPHPISKGNGKHRIICIPTVKDRLVQRVILRRLTQPKDLLRVLNSVSYGVSRGKEQGTHAAVDKTIKLRRGKPWILKTDISAFFDNIPRQYLIDRVRKRLRRHSLVPLLECIIGTEIDERDKDKKEIVGKNGIVRGKGLRQGMPLSPLLSNLVLSDFDKKLAEQGITVVRYVDDLIVFANSEDECFKAKTVIERELEKVELSIPDLGIVDSKTEIVSPEDPVIFLGFEIYKMKNGEYAKKIPDEAINEAYAKLEAEGSYSNCIEKGRDSLASVLSWLGNVPSGYRASYGGATNLDTFLIEVKKRTDTVKRSLLEEIFGKEIFTKLTDDKLRFLGFLHV